MRAAPHAAHDPPARAVWHDRRVTADDPGFTEREFQIRDLNVVVLDSRPDAMPLEKAFVLVHGLGVSSLYFRELARHLAPHARVVTVDLPGFGRADTPDRTLRIPSFALALIDTIERLGLHDAVLVGHSMGVQVVVEALRRQPTIASAGVLIGPVVNGAERRAPTVVRRFLQAASRETPASAWPSIRAWLSCGPRWFIDTFPAMLAYPIEERIAEVRADLALIAGEYDRLAPGPWLDVLRAAAGSERVTVDVVPNASHQVMVTHPERVVDGCLDIAGLT